MKYYNDLELGSDGFRQDFKSIYTIKDKINKLG